MSRQTTIDKIQKLRALASNQASTLEEAATAARIAEKLIQENSVQEAELEATSDSKEGAVGDEVAIVTWNQRQTVWQTQLLQTLAKAYDVEGILSHRNGKLGYYAVGRASDIATLRYQFAWFSSELTRLSSILAPSWLGRGSGKTWYKSFYLGAVNAIDKSLQSAKQEVRVSASLTALTVLNNHALESKALFRQLYPQAKVVTTAATSLDRSAYELGQRTGSGLGQSPSLGAGVRGYLGK